MEEKVVDKHWTYPYITVGSYLSFVLSSVLGLLGSELYSTATTTTLFTKACCLSPACPLRREPQHFIQKINKKRNKHFHYLSVKRWNPPNFFKSARGNADLFGRFAQTCRRYEFVHSLFKTVLSGQDIELQLVYSCTTCRDSVGRWGSWSEWSLCLDNFGGWV